MQDFKNISTLLRKFRMELHDRMNVEEIEKCKKLQNKMRAALNNYQKRGATIELLEDVIEEYEQHLVELEAKYGMGLPNKADPYGGIAA